jgi:hypothetical protein
MYLILAWMTMVMVIRGGDEYTVRSFQTGLCILFLFVGEKKPEVKRIILPFSNDFRIL